jgi:hypothetical protein
MDPANALIVLILILLIFGTRAFLFAALIIFATSQELRSKVREKLDA